MAKKALDALEVGIWKWSNSIKPENPPSLSCSMKGQKYVINQGHQ